VKRKPKEKIDVLYICRPQVEKWSIELLEKYQDSLPSIKAELERRAKYTESKE